jgi:hypothetical protein
LVGTYQQNIFLKRWHLSIPLHLGIYTLDTLDTLHLRYLGIYFYIKLFIVLNYINNSYFIVEMKRVKETVNCSYSYMWTNVLSVNVLN